MSRLLLFLTFINFAACGTGPKDPEPTSTGTSGGDPSTTSALTGDPQTGSTSVDPSGVNTGSTGGDASTSTGPGNISDTTGEVTGDITATILTTGASMHGQCGWDNVAGKYACSPAGTPGMQDPAGVHAIDCPRGSVAGTRCNNEDGPISSVGCCQGSGDRLYCDVDEQMVVIAEPCGV